MDYINPLKMDTVHGVPGGKVAYILKNKLYLLETSSHLTVYFSIYSFELYSHPSQSHDSVWLTIKKLQENTTQP